MQIIYRKRIINIKNRYKITLREIEMGGENLYEDLALLNKEIEICIREQPERYLWIHRRFKHRPKNTQDIYDESLLRKRLN